MIVRRLKYYILLILIGTLFSCQENEVSPEKPPSQDTTNYHKNEHPPVDNSIPSTSITWDTTARKISHNVGYAEYGRVYRLNGDTLLLTYHCGPNKHARHGAGVDIAMRKSLDNGKTWGDARILMDGPQPGYRGFQNPALLELRNGWLILAFVGKGKPNDNTHDDVQIMISKDRGKDWSDPRVIARGRSWEPDMVQLPDGTIDMFYSSEAAWWPPKSQKNKLQDIFMIRSSDNGHTWTSPKEVSFSNGHRDGMAVPLILAGGKGIVFSIESVRNRISPWIVWSSLGANFNYKKYGAIQNGRRWPMFVLQNFHGGAPYLIQLPSGETVLSSQFRGGRKISFWKKNTMAVFVGNSIATHFTNVSYPWPNLPTDEGAYFSSLFLKNDSTIVLVSTRNFPDNHSEIWWKEGHIHY
jgi:hypothetical protein